MPFMLCLFFPVVSKDLNLVLNMDIKGIICIKFQYGDS